MYGEHQDKIVCIQCVCCNTWIAVRLDPDDLDRRMYGGIPVQDAFCYPSGRPYLSAAERELLITAVCGACYLLLCPSDVLAYD